MELSFWRVVNLCTSILQFVCEDNPNQEHPDTFNPDATKHVQARARPSAVFGCGGGVGGNGVAPQIEIF